MFKPAPKRKRSPELLGSDESSAGEDNGPDQSRTEKSKDSSNKPRTLKHLPGQLPDLPPKHSYMRTVVSAVRAILSFILTLLLATRRLLYQSLH